MKLSAAFVFLASLCHATDIVSLVLDLPYKENGYQNISLPYNLADAPHKNGFVFRHILSFNSGEADIRIAPHADENGSPSIRAVVLTHARGITLDGPNPGCQLEKGNRVSHDQLTCSVEIPSSNYDHWYNLVLNKSGPKSWEFYVVDADTDTVTNVASWSTKFDDGKIHSRPLGAVTYFDNDFNVATACNQLPFTSVTFGNPIAEGRNATYLKPHLTPLCEGQIPYKATTVDDGILIEVGGLP